MSNVIPQEARKEVARLYRARYLLAGSLVALCVATGAALALLPSYLALHATVPPAQPQDELALTQDDRREVVEAQALLRALASFATTTPVDALLTTLARRGEHVRIDHFAYTPGTLLVGGTADTPTALDAYRKTLAAEQIFAGASVPVSDLVGSKNGSFSMTLTGNF